MQRKFPKHYERLVALAKEFNLTCPEGRAIHACSRIANAGWYPDSPHEVDNLRSIRLETAEKWLIHWNNGGSIKAICRSHEEELQRNRAKRENNRPNLKMGERRS